VDGQLARYTQRFSALGARLDAVFDRTKEHLVYAGLAVGAARAGAPVWTLATATLGLQTARHMLDYATIAARGPAQPAAAAPARPTPWTWAKRLASFPIGERFAVISATAAVATPRTTFTVLLAWGGVGVVYMLAGRLRAPVDPGARPALAALRDDGPLARALLRGRLPLPVAWAAPGAVRAAEYGGLLWLAARAGGSAVPACFGLLCALAYHHYDVAYRRQMAGRTPPAWLNAAALGWEGRLLAAAALAAGGTLAAGYAAGAAVLAAVFVGESLTGWSRAAVPAPEPACPC
jgi:hypothetical protein